MNLNLNDPDEFTIRGVHRLLASKTGSEPADHLPGTYQLRVTKNGIAYIKDNWQPSTDSDWQNHAILFPAWGSRCVGADAARTAWWVNHVYQMLKRSWERCVKVEPHRMGEAFYADHKP
jgi:hypothetical protein